MPRLAPGIAVAVLLEPVAFGILATPLPACDRRYALAASAVGFTASIGQYLPTVFVTHDSADADAAGGQRVHLE